jgi:hypothetical protein
MKAKPYFDPTRMTLICVPYYVGETKHYEYPALSGLHHDKITIPKATDFQQIITSIYSNIPKPYFSYTLLYFLQG